MRVETMMLCATLACSVGWQSRSSSKFYVGDWRRQHKALHSESVRGNNSFVKGKFNANYQTREEMASNSYNFNSVAYQNTDARQPRTDFMNKTSVVSQNFRSQHFKSRGQQMSASKARKFLMTKLEDIARALLSLGLMNSCSQGQSKNIEALFEEIVSLTLFTTEMNEDEAYSRIQKYGRKLLSRQNNENIPLNYCQGSDDVLVTATKSLKSIVSNMDDGLVFFFGQELDLIDSISSPVPENLLTFPHLADKACRKWASPDKIQRISCVQKLQSLSTVFSSLLNEFKIKGSDLERQKRSLEEFSKNPNITKKRSGYGDSSHGYRQKDHGYSHGNGYSYGGHGYGDGGHKYGDGGHGYGDGGYGYGDSGHGYDGGYGYGEGYEDDSSNLILIPTHDNTDDYDKKLIKLIGALAIGTYCILGVLVLKTLLSHLFAYRRPGPIGDKGFRGMNGMKGVKGEKGDKGMPGEKGPQGAKGVKGAKGALGAQIDGDPGPTGPAGVDGGAGEPGVQGDGGDAGEPGEMGDRGEPGDPGMPGSPGSPGQSGRKRRSLRKSEKKNLVTESFIDLPILLDSLYTLHREKENRLVSSETIADVVSRLNHLWSVYKDPAACGKCSLFDFLQDEDAENLDAFILAGFAHVLGDAGSLQLLHQVRAARRSGTKMRCRRSKNSCDLEILSLPRPIGGSAHLWREVY